MTYIDLVDILSSDKPSNIIRCNENAIFSFIPELKRCKGFDQKNEWHVYDVYEHILHVVDNVNQNLVIRLAALFHDIGKPFSYTEDENGVGHFYGHWEVSQRIFIEFANKYNIDVYIRDNVSQLIYFHDINLSKLDSVELIKIIDIFDNAGIMQLFDLKKADLLAQNKKYNYILNEYNIQKKKILQLKGVDPNQ